MKTNKRIIALLMCILMCVSLFPAAAFADADTAAEENSVDFAMEEVAEEPAEEQEIAAVAEEPETEPQQAELMEETSGTCGDNLTWSVNDGTLTISGTGAMADYEIGTSPWYGSIDLISRVVINDGVTSIGTYAFYGCSSLTNATIGRNVTSVGKGAFSHCDILASVTFLGDAPTFDAHAFGDYDKDPDEPPPDAGDGKAISCYYPINNNTWTGSIFGGYFGRCTGWTGLDDLTWTIENGTLTISGTGGMTDYSGTGRDEDGICTGSTAPWSADASSIKAIVIEDGVTSIGSAAFAGCSQATSVTIPDGVTSIGMDAFNGCSSLKSVTLPASITIIRSGLFAGCSSLTSVTIPAGPNRISDKAFYNCSSLISLTIPASVRSINDNAFENCTGLTSIKFKGNAPEFGEGIFSENKLTVYYPAGDETWDDYDTYYDDDNIQWVPYTLNLIQSVSLTIPAPVGYSELPTAEDITVTDGNCTVQSVTWYHVTEDGKELVTGKAADGEEYTVVIKLQAEDDYSFEDGETPVYLNQNETAEYFVSDSMQLSVSVRMTADTHTHVSVTDPAVAATCTETGLAEGSHCSVCGEIIVAQETVPALGHTIVIDAAVTATCTEPGLTEGSHCSVCDEIIVAQETVPALGHDLTHTDAAAATCTTAGNIEYWMCSVCGKYYSDEACTTEITINETVIPAKGHTTVIDAAVAATCTEPGLTKGSHCSLCGETIVAQETVPALGHDLVYTAAKAATTTETGNIEYWTCSRCGKTYSDAEGTVEISLDDTVIPLRKSFSISYELNGGVNNPDNPTELLDGDNHFTLLYPTREGYVFDGWYETADFSVAAPEVNENVESDLTFYAKWNPITYSVTFNGNGTKTGKMADCTAVLYDEELALPANAFTRKGYDFAGWNTMADGSGTEFADEATVGMLANTEGAKVTLYAQWELTAYTITYELYGADNAESNPEEYNITSAITLAAPTSDNLGTFMGWYSDPTFKTKATGIKAGTTGDKTFYAKWGEATYSISYELFGGENDPANPVSYTASDKITLRNPVSAPSGDCVFAGWYSDANYKTKVTTIKAGSYGDKTLYAKWTAKTKYTIKYELNGGKNAKNPTSYTFATPTISLLEPTLKGYIFLGWYNNADFTGEQIAEIETGSEGNLTLYAKWEKEIYSITYITRDGINAPENPADYAVDSAAIKLANPTRAGYIFGGWYSDSALKTKVTQIKKGSVGDITLYAKWTAITYTVKFNGNGSSTSKTSGSMSNQSVSYSSCITLKANKFTRKGFTFTGWNTMADGSGVNYADQASILNLSQTNKATVTLYAQWDVIVYNISYELDGGEAPAEGNPATYTVENAITLANPTKTGYTFAGWYTDANLKTKANLKAGNIGDKTFYAKWTANKYTVKFDANGGTGKMSNLSMTYGVSKALTNNSFKRTGYTFIGWALTPDAEEAEYTNKQAVADLTAENKGTVTLYAVWDK